MQNDQSKKMAACQRWLYGWFGSFFGIATTILLTHALIATWIATDKVWTLVAWLLLGAHILSYVWMCLWLWMLLGVVLPYAASAGKPNNRDQPTPAE